MNEPYTLGLERDPARRLRARWATLLRKQLSLREMTSKELRLELERRGLNVTRQAVDQWLAGKTSPRPHHQAVIAAVFQVPVESLFPIEVAA